MNQNRKETEDYKLVFFPTKCKYLGKTSFFCKPDKAIDYMIAKYYGSYLMKLVRWDYAIL